MATKPQFFPRNYCFPSENCTTHHFGYPDLCTDGLSGVGRTITEYVLMVPRSLSILTLGPLKCLYHSRFVRFYLEDKSSCSSVLCMHLHRSVFLFSSREYGETSCSTHLPPCLSPSQIKRPSRGFPTPYLNWKANALLSPVAREPFAFLHRPSRRMA